MSLLLVDLDGTIREPLSGQQYFQHPKDQRIIAGADVAIRAYKDDWIIVGITNQGGVAAGYKSIQECIKEQQYTLELFPELREIYFCPDFEGKKCFPRHSPQCP
jgi:D-glycero-D-manno-heptose 1,7-bisphosphate phosphatase